MHLYQCLHFHYKTRVHFKFLSFHICDFLFSSEQFSPLIFCMFTDWVSPPVRKKYPVTSRSHLMEYTFCTPHSSA